jgi:hypothetical protein
VWTCTRERFWRDLFVPGVSFFGLSGFVKCLTDILIYIYIYIDICIDRSSIVNYTWPLIEKEEWGVLRIDPLVDVHEK